MSLNTPDENPTLEDLQEALSRCAELYQKWYEAAKKSPYNPKEALSYKFKEKGELKVCEIEPFENRTSITLEGDKLIITGDTALLKTLNGQHVLQPCEEGIKTVDMDQPIREEYISQIDIHGFAIHSSLALVMPKILTLVPNSDIFTSDVPTKLIPFDEGVDFVKKINTILLYYMQFFKNLEDNKKIREKYGEKYTPGSPPPFDDGGSILLW